MVVSLFYSAKHKHNKMNENFIYFGFHSDSFTTAQRPSSIVHRPYIFINNNNEKVCETINQWKKIRFWIEKKKYV